MIDLGGKLAERDHKVGDSEAEKVDNNGQFQ